MSLDRKRASRRTLFTGYFALPNNFDLARALEPAKGGLDLALERNLIDGI